MQTMHLDKETRSEAEISLGSYEYSCHPSTRIACLSATIGTEWFAFRFPLTGPRHQPWPFPVEPKDLVVWAWNVSFEQNIWRNVLGWPEPGQWRCTMALAAANGMPTTLAGCAEYLKIGGGKDKEGQKVMKRVCIPGKDGTFAEPTEEDWADLQRYCRHDVELESAIHERLGDLTPTEVKVWEACNRINQRGIPIDRALCEAGLAASRRIRDTLGPQVLEASGGVITSEDLTKVETLRLWTAGKLCEDVKDLRAGTLANLLKRKELPEAVRIVLEARRFVSKISVTKLQAMLDRTKTDGRLRGQKKYYGAQKSGRWRSEGEQTWRDEESGVQVDNLPKAPPGVKPEKAIAAVLSEDLEALEAAGLGDYESALKSIVRPAIMAPSGNLLLVCDYSAIEARIILWLAEDDAHLEDFRKSDAGLGPEPYCIFGGRLLGRIITKEADPLGRDAGKVGVLQCGFGAGPESVGNTAKSWGIDLAAAGTTPEAIVATYRKEYLSLAGNYYNGGTDGLWKRIDKCVAAVIAGEVDGIATCGRLKLRMGERGELRVLFPSGRVHCYNEARLEWVDKEFKRKGKGGKEFVEKKRMRCIFYTDYSSNKNGVSIETFGAKLSQNFTEGVGRDLLGHTLVRCEEEGLPVVMHTHDEGVPEVPESEAEAGLRRLEHIMRHPPAWAEGLPINVEGYVTRRYAKKPIL